MSKNPTKLLFFSNIRTDLYFFVYQPLFAEETYFLSYTSKLARQPCQSEQLFFSLQKEKKRKKKVLCPFPHANIFFGGGHTLRWSADIKRERKKCPSRPFSIFQRTSRKGLEKGMKERPTQNVMSAQKLVQSLRENVVVVFCSSQTQQT